ncbi:hypothetical protein QEZ54_20390 [Catellatospora sp. KI3]|uniref:hypothetical protein n=1 Tax=Catellatospora sp. KI3 TaxID=3041620 RepID=UPI0024824845|nr:hypothetical protein [Catellatospora sp. KI3]MDI1463345.1 hypothetical protein [Catellatospora sp. KI3]
MRKAIKLALVSGLVVAGLGLSASPAGALDIPAGEACEYAGQLYYPTYRLVLPDGTDMVCTSHGVWQVLSGPV